MQIENLCTEVQSLSAGVAEGSALFSHLFNIYSIELQVSMNAFLAV